MGGAALQHRSLTRLSRSYAAVGKNGCGSSMISQIFKTAAEGARMAPLYGGVRRSSPAQQAMMICKGMATHSLAVLRDEFGQRLPFVVSRRSHMKGVFVHSSNISVSDNDVSETRGIWLE